MKTALVTGSSRGIGREIARALARDGFAVAIHYRQCQEQAQRLLRELREKTIAIAFQADIADVSQVSNLVSFVFDQFGHLDVLVNNAAISQQKLLTDVSPSEWDTMMQTNLSGVFYATQSVLPAMIDQKSGSIINVSSMWGQVGASCEVPYSTAKAGIIGFTKALAKEVGPSGIRVNCIAPGVIDTDMNAALDEQALAQLKEETPLGRLGRAEDVAELAAFLASDKASFITGQVLGVNGGLII